MNIVQRALLSLGKRMSKTIILLLAVFVLGNVIAGAVSIKEATQNVEESMKNQLGASASIEYDINNLGDTIENLSPQKLKEIERLKEVKSVSYTSTEPIGSKQLKPYSSNTSNGGPQMDFEGMEYTLIGDTDHQSKEFNAGKMEIVEGRKIDQSDEENKKNTVLLSEELAKKNNVKAGDTIRLNVTVWGGEPEPGQAFTGPKNVGEKEFEAEVVGIYKSVSIKDKNKPKYANDVEKNTIYSSVHFTEEIGDFSARTLFEQSGKGTIDDYRSIVLPQYILNSYDDIASFEQQVKEIIPTGYKLNTSAKSYESVAGSIRNMQGLSSKVLVVGVIASIAVLSLILVLFLKERKHEFGLYKALGESSVKTITQVLIEVFVITILGVSLALFSGNKLAEKLSGDMLTSQLETDEKQSQDGMIVMPGSDSAIPEIDKEELKESYKIEFDEEYILSFYGIMLTTGVVATLIPMGYVLRLKPKEILL